jgi:hypothetical protein
VNEASFSLFDQLFKLRLEILSNRQLVNRIFEGLDDLLTERIKQQFKSVTVFKDLEQSFINSINIYRQINLTIIGKFESNEFILLDDEIDNSSMKFSTFKHLLSNYSFGREIPFLLTFLESSLMLDYAFIVTELVFDKELQMTDDEIKTLNQLLKNSIEDYAVGASFLGLWKPEEDDESQWMRNIKIRIASQEAKETNDFFPISTLKELINH